MRKSRTIEQSFVLVYCVYFASTDNILKWIYEVYEEYDLRFTICDNYSWEKALNVGLDASLYDL
jgi:hypothetical protein